MPADPQPLLHQKGCARQAWEAEIAGLELHELPDVGPVAAFEEPAWKTCATCGVLYDEAYCPRCEEVGGC